MLQVAPQLSSVLVGLPGPSSTFPLPIRIPLSLRGLPSCRITVGSVHHASGKNRSPSLRTHHAPDSLAEKNSSAKGADGLALKSSGGPLMPPPIPLPTRRPFPLNALLRGIRHAEYAIGSGNMSGNRPEKSFPATDPAIECVKTRILVHFGGVLTLSPRKAKAAELLGIQRLSLVAGVGFEPTTFRS